MSDLSIRIQALLSTSNDNIKKSLTDIQRLVDSNKPISIVSEFNGDQLVRQTQQFNTELGKTATIVSTINRTTGEWEVRSTVREDFRRIREDSSALEQNLQSISEILVAVGLAKVIKEIAGAFVEATNAAIVFESAMIEVQKKTSFDAFGLQTIRQEILNLANDIPLTEIEIAKIAATAGQLGIAEENILSFTRVMANMGVATTLSSEQAAINMARLANITNMSQTDFENLGSAISKLGNNFAATETEISNFALRVGSAAKQAGMSEADIVGLSAGLASVGLRAESAGTSFSKLINRINLAVSTGSKEVEDFARVANMSVEQFVQLWGTDAVYAVLAFTEGLSDTERLGKNTVAMLSELGMEEIRLSDSMRRAASSGDLFRNAVETANEAWDANISLANEAALKYGTTASQLQLLENATNRVRISIGDALLPAINAVAGVFTNVALGVADFASQNEGLTRTITVLLGIVSLATAGLISYAAAMKAIAILDMAKYFVGLTNAINSAKLSIAILQMANLGLVGSIKAVTAALWAQAAAWATHPLGMALIVAASIFALVKAVDALSDSYEKQKQKLSDLSAEYQHLISELESTQSKLEEIESKMSDLLAMDTLTLTDEAELSLLQKESEELERQVTLLKMQADIAREEANRAALDAAQSLYRENLQSGRANGYESRVDSLISEHNRLIEEQNRLRAEGNDLTDKQEKRLIYIKRELSDIATEFQYTANGISKNDEYSMGWRNTLLGVVDQILNISKTAEQIRLDKFSEVLNAEDFASVKAELEALGREGQVTADVLSDPKYSDFISTLNDIGISAEDVANQLNRMQTESEGFSVALSSLDEIAISANQLSIAVQGWQDAQSKTEQEYQKSQIDSILKAWLELIKDINDAELRSAAFIEYERAAESAMNIVKQLEFTTKDLDSALTQISRAFKEQSDNVSLSTNTILGLIDAGYAAILVIDQETGAVTINADAFERLANQQINARIAKLEFARLDITSSIRAERAEIDSLGQAYDRFGMSARMAAEERLKALAAEGKSIELELAAIENIRSRLGDVPAGTYGGSSRATRTSSSSKDPWKEEFDRQLKDLKHLHDASLISEEEYLNRLRVLNDKYFKDRAKYLDEYRKHELDVSNSLLKLHENRLNAQLDLAQFQGNYDRQLEIFNQFQADLRATANRYRELGFSETSKEITDLQEKYREYGRSIQAVYQEIYENGIRPYVNSLSDLKFELDGLAQNDFDGKVSILSQKISEQEKIISANRVELDRLTKLYQSGVMSADAFREASERLHKEWQSGVIAARQYAESINQIRLDQLNQQKDSMMEIISLTKSLIQQETKDRVDGLKAQTQELKDQNSLLNDRKKVLDDLFKKEKDAANQRKKDLDEEFAA